MFSTLCSLLRRGVMTAAATSALLVVAAQSAQATPIQLDAAQFTSQTSGLAVAVEDFESFGGPNGNPFPFSNGSFAGGNPWVVDKGNFCRNNKCLIDFASVWRPKVISAFPAGTQFWAADLAIVNGGSDPFNITVTGGSGTLSLTQVLLEDLSFVGFFDPLGILSVSFQNMGTRTGNSTSYSTYGVDNVRTAGGAAAVAVPEPGTLALFGLGLLGLGMARRRKDA